MVLQKIGCCRLAVRLVRCHPNQQLVHLAVGEGAFRKIGKGIGRAFCEILNGHGVNGRGRVHCRLRCLAICLRDAIFKMGLIDAAAEIDFNHLVFAEDGGRCPVIAEPGLLALVCLCERTVEARGGAWVDQLKSCVRELQRREEVAARDLAVPTGGTADEAGLRRVFGMLKEFRVFFDAGDGREFRHFVDHVFRYPEALLAAVGEGFSGDAETLLINALLQRFGKGIGPKFGRYPARLFQSLRFRSASCRR